MVLLNSSPPTAAVFFDRDNTLIANDGYLGDPAGVRLMAGAADAVAKARALGYAVVVVSNQSGVARGLFTEDDVRAVDRRMAELLLGQNPRATIDRHDFCPFHPAAARPEYRQDSDLRKPKPGMYFRSLSALGLQAVGGWAVGDAPRDITAGKAAGLRTILFRPGSVSPSPAASEPSVTQPDFEVATLEQAMTIIERETPAAPSASAARNPASLADNLKAERQLEAILVELKKANTPDTEFSITKLLAGVLQIVVLALLVFVYLRWQDNQLTVKFLLLGTLLQSLVVALLVMGRQR